MKFDQLARVAERDPRVPRAVREAVDRARLFVFDVNPHEALPDGYSPEQIKFLNDNFYLPFPCVAVEDKASCIVVWDRQEGESPPVGQWGRRWFLELIDFGQTDRTAFADGPALADRLDAIARTHMKVITMGNVDGLRADTEGASVNVQLEWIATTGGPGDDWAFVDGRKLSMEDHYAFIKPFGQNVHAAIQELMLLCDPETFILESTPLSALQRKEPKLKPGQFRRIARAHERPQYTVLKPHEIRSRMNLPPPERGGSRVRPHERRSHLRTLQSSYFSHKQGMRILIPACWVGPHESFVDKRRYRVVLDHG